MLIFTNLCRYSLIVTVFLLTVTRAQQSFFPSSVPLSVRSPYLNVWYASYSGSVALSDAWPWIWQLENQIGWTGLIRVDNITYTWLGHNVPYYHGIANVTDIQITPTRSIFLMQAGPVRMNVTFFSPIEPSDWVKQSLPFSYLSVDVDSLDGQSHSVQMYSDITAEWATGERPDSLDINWTQSETSSSFYYEIEPKSPQQYQESNAQADDGKAYYVTAVNNHSPTWQVDTDKNAIQDFVVRGALSNITNISSSGPFNTPWFVFATVVDLGLVQSTSGSPVVYCIGYIRDPSVLFINATGDPEPRRPYYVTRFNSSTEDLIEAFVSDFHNASARGLALDSRIMTDAASISSKYVDLVSLGARQSFGALDITTSSQADPSDILVFMKDIGSSNRINPVERMFAAFPIYLYLNATLCGDMLKPLLILQDGQPEPYAAPDIGSPYPQATASGPVGDSMQGVEQSGNMLIMLYAYARFSGDGDLLAEHYNLAKRWANYLCNNTLAFDNQISADGESNPNMTNLAIKGIIGVKAMAEIAHALGVDDDAEFYNDAAMNLVASWESLALSSSRNHLLGMYNEQQSWALMYNIYADRLLGTDLVSQQILDYQTSYYNETLLSLYSNDLGVPIDSVLSANASTAWMMFTAGMVTDENIRDQLISIVWSMASYNQTHGAFVNDYNYQTGAVNNGSASPALGAVFSLLALKIPNVTITSSITVNTTLGIVQTPHQSKNSKLGPIIGGVAGGILAVAVSAFWFWRRKQHQNRHTSGRPQTYREPVTAVIENVCTGRSALPYDHVVEPYLASTPMLNNLSSSKMRQETRTAPFNSRSLLVRTSVLPVNALYPDAVETPQVYSDMQTTAGTASVMMPSEVVELRAEVENLRQVMQVLRTERLEPPPEYHSEYVAI